MLAGQAVHEELPAAEKEPALQGEQLDMPDDKEKVPALHATQRPLELKKPAEHVTQVVALEGADAPEPEGHVAHEVAPACAVYVPAPQMEQIELPAPDDAVAEPAGHGTHPDDPDEAATVPGGQEKHTLALLAPTMVLKVPTPHSTHCAPDR